MTTTCLAPGRVLGYSTAESVVDLKGRFPLSASARERVETGRREALAIVSGCDPRLLVIAGPCSIHDPDVALKLAERLARIASSVESKILLLMRFYAEKPRTTVGWKGYENDPYLDASCDAAAGRLRTRALATEITAHVAVAGELLNLAGTATYLDDVYAWGGIGARTCTSQPHREVVSGLPFSVGFKNATGGDLDGAIGGMLAAARPHTYLAPNPDGVLAVVRTTGNYATHIVLRGSAGSTNYDVASAQKTNAALTAAGLPPRRMVDCSHGNARRKGDNQIGVFRECIRQHVQGEPAGLVGAMLETNLFPGKQALGADPSKLRFGVSITDECIGINETEDLLLEAYEALPCVAARISA